MKLSCHSKSTVSGRCLELEQVDDLLALDVVEDEQRTQASHSGDCGEPAASYVEVPAEGLETAVAVDEIPPWKRDQVAAIGVVHLT